MDVEAVEYFCFRFQLRMKLVASEFASSFFKVLPLPQKFNRFHSFRFHIPGFFLNQFSFPHSTSVAISSDFSISLKPSYFSNFPAFSTLFTGTFFVHLPLRYVEAIAGSG